MNIWFQLVAKVALIWFNLELHRNNQSIYRKLIHLEMPCKLVKC